jgi:hypothetical protein
MKRVTKSKQKRAMPGTVIDARGVTLSAGVAAFDEVLVKQFKDIVSKAPADAEQIKSKGFGEAGPVLGPAAVELPLPHPYQHGDDDAA